MDDISLQVQKIFNERFTGEPAMYFSPGRINLIGEHVDYNDGFVLPAAIDMGIYYAVSLNDSDEINFYSIDFDEALCLKVEDVRKMDGWKNYVLGIVNQYVQAGREVKGFNCAFGGDIANGAGISSSAAVEGGLSMAMNDLMHFELNRKELALLGQRAEHSYPDVKCGIMDQYANMFGKKDHVILLDCQSITHEYYPLRLKGYSIILINTNVHHSLAASAYNQRRRECEEGLEIMKKEAGIQSFRDIKSIDILEKYEDKMSREVYMRCYYVVSEILRTQKAATLLKEDKIPEFGELMFQTHEGLRDLYMVSCAELDFLVNLASKSEAVVGARLMGGGFGGCTINIVKNDGKEQFVAQALKAYKDEFHIKAEAFEVKAGDGVSRIDSSVSQKSDPR